MLSIKVIAGRLDIIPHDDRFQIRAAPVDIK
jgi:hypothetical protein